MGLSSGLLASHMTLRRLLRVFKHQSRLMENGENDNVSKCCEEIIYMAKCLVHWPAYNNCLINSRDLNSVNESSLTNYIVMNTILKLSKSVHISIF